MKSCQDPRVGDGFMVGNNRSFFLDPKFNLKSRAY